MADRGIRAGKAFVEILADNNPLAHGLRAASAMLHGWGNPLAGLDRLVTAAKGSFGTHALGRSLGGTEPIQKQMLKELQGMNGKLSRLIEKTDPLSFD